MELEVLDDIGLAKRWHKNKEDGVTAEAIAKWIDRLCNKKRALHLKSFKAGKKRLFRLEDVKDWEERHTKHFLASLTALSAYGDDDAESWFEPY